MGQYRPVNIKTLSLGDGTCKICIPLTPKHLEDIGPQLGRILAAKPDLIEWRADYLEDAADHDHLLSAAARIRQEIGSFPLLFTFRTGAEGGETACSDELYASLTLEAAISGFVDAVDVEIHRDKQVTGRLIPAVHRAGLPVIVSCHDFQKTPNEQTLLELFLQMQQAGGDITKLAVMPGSRRDVLTLLSASVQMEEQFADRPFIAMSMGSLGTISRVASQFTGSALTFATAGQASAPGQAAADAMQAALGILGRCVTA